MDTFQGDLIFNQVFDLDIRMFLLLYEPEVFPKRLKLLVAINRRSPSVFRSWKSHWE